MTVREDTIKELIATEKNPVGQTPNSRERQAHAERARKEGRRNQDSL